jgi:hypothetical protein
MGLSFRRSVDVSEVRTIQRVQVLDDRPQCKRDPICRETAEMLLRFCLLDIATRLFRCATKPAVRRRAGLSAVALAIAERREVSVSI